MKTFTKGSDLTIRWSICNSEGKPFPIEGTTYMLRYETSAGTSVVRPTLFSVEGSVVTWHFPGAEQPSCGKYSVTLKLYRQGKVFCTVTKQDAFALVNGGSAFPAVLDIISHADFYEAPLQNTTGQREDAGMTQKAITDALQSVENPGYVSLRRLREYLYEVTFDSLKEDNGGDNPLPSGCSSYVKDGKLYRNLDFKYDNSASFIVKTKDFEGMSFITGLDDGNLDKEKIAQLPYRVVDGRNKYGVMVSAHVLFNDWNWSGSGERNIPLTRLPFLLLSKLTAPYFDDIEENLGDVLNNLYVPDSMGDYLLQVLVTDGYQTLALMPPTEAGQPYVIQNISDIPKLANFRWVSRETVAITDADIQTRPTGIERFNAMPQSLYNLRFTYGYETATRLSEFIGINGTTKESSTVELYAIYLAAQRAYYHRTRDGHTWHTMHSVVYGNGMEELYIQEDWTRNMVASKTVVVQETGDSTVNVISQRTVSRELEWLEGLLQKKADDISVVHNIGDEYIFGNKDFINSALFEGSEDVDILLSAEEFGSLNIQAHYPDTEIKLRKVKGIRGGILKTLSPQIFPSGFTIDYIACNLKLWQASTYPPEDYSKFFLYLDDFPTGFFIPQDGIMIHPNTAFATELSAAWGKAWYAMSSWFNVEKNYCMCIHMLTPTKCQIVFAETPELNIAIEKQKTATISGNGIVLHDATKTTPDFSAIVSTGNDDSSVNLQEKLNEFELSSNKTNTLTGSDTQYPTTGAVKSVTDALDERINNISSFGRFMSNWDCRFGLPTSNPGSLPYAYKAGDFFLIDVVNADTSYPDVTVNGERYCYAAQVLGSYPVHYSKLGLGSSGIFFADVPEVGMVAYPSPQGGSSVGNVSAISAAGNYMPDGSLYNGHASTIPASDEVKVGDIWRYDGLRWLLEINSKRDVPFSAITGEPTDNVKLAEAFGGKVDKIPGKGLSTNDYNNEDKEKLADLPTDVVEYNTEQTLTDEQKEQARGNIGAVRQEDGKGLSTNDYTDEDKAKVDTIPSRELSSNKKTTLDDYDVHYPTTGAVKRVTDDLQEQVSNISEIGRFLSSWNMAIGMPLTDPTTDLPYGYRKGDYFLVSIGAYKGKVVTINGVKYYPTTTTPLNTMRLYSSTARTGAFINVDRVPEVGDVFYDGPTAQSQVLGTVSAVEDSSDYGFVPSGSEYDGTPSIDPATEEVPVNSMIVYDGTRWIVLSSGGKQVGFANIIGEPTDNVKLAEALGGKVDKIPGKGLSTNDYTDAEKSKVAEIANKEDSGNKVTSISSSSTDTEYPSAKCVYDIVGDIETVLGTIIGE